MNNLTIAQKVYLAALLAVAGAWLGLELGVPIYEYNYGKSGLTALLSHLSPILLAAGVGIVIIGFVLQGMGILPTVLPDPGRTVPVASVRGIGNLRNLAIWIFIALLLVFLFNLFQGNDGGNKAQSSNVAPAQNFDLMTILINWFPMLLIFGVWAFFLRKMQAQQGKNTDKPNNP
jgi:hypothetical protein